MKTNAEYQELEVELIMEREKVIHLEDELERVRQQRYDADLRFANSNCRIGNYYKRTKKLMWERDLLTGRVELAAQMLTKAKGLLPRQDLDMVNKFLHELVTV